MKTEDIAPAAETPTNQVYASFCGAIDAGALQRLTNAAGLMQTNKVTRLHLLFQSAGGNVGDGIFLYSYLRALPLDVSVYNVGGVYSIAAIAFLGAKTRKTSAHAAFMLHRSAFIPNATTATKLKSTTQSLLIDDQRTEAILREHLVLSDAQWTELNYHELWFSGDDAVKIKLATEIGEFAPPKGTQIFTL